MADIADADLALLRSHARERSPGRWTFLNAEEEEAALLEGRGTVPVHDPGSALNIIRACLALDVRVTDVLSGTAWNRVVMKLAGLEARVSDLEAWARSGGLI